ncbi:MAG TPA: SGNH/GDSL hydrolase family protein [Promineifilum sp.]|nr:SGNH/GDSL hydrolase family protein [Promineifilum sp.]HRO22735.1 SGNH/GDSL hydrolase family protein [Promineifilum sp.]HRO89008.1 SGNH/GDSL hydrolase family protein [Promineifilum sp.]HRQ13505.1 SGNH/GDSL hydrolase family protein [Promineifilum sp.]
MAIANHSSQGIPPEHTHNDVDWRSIARIIIKAAILFAILNALFAACRPVEWLGAASLYNRLITGRQRLPYGEVPEKDYNLTLNNIPAMFAAHEWERPKKDDEFRVLLIGDSGTWGWFLRNDDTLAGQLNTMGLKSADGRRVVVYNLGYPVMSLTKDLLLLDEALNRSQADLILWPVTLQSLARGRQLEHPLLHENAERVRALIDRYSLALDKADERFVIRSFIEESIVGRRRDLADLTRLQAWGFAWAATGKDQDIPEDIPLRKSDLEADERWLDIAKPRPLEAGDLSMDVLIAGIRRANTTPIVIINEPIFISEGANSDIRYNSFYPRWAYDEYRELMKALAEAEGWTYLDLWDAIPPEEFTDTPVHLTPNGSRLFAELISAAVFDGSAP